MLEKAFSISSSHLYSTSFFNKAFIDFTSLEKFGMNLQMKLIFPKNEYKPFLFNGYGSHSIPSTLSKSILMPSFDMTCPNSFPLSTPKTEF